MSKMKSFFASLKAINIFSKKELVLIGVTSLLSLLIASSVWWSPAAEVNVPRYRHYGYEINVKTATGGTVKPFNTQFDLFYNSSRPQEEIERAVDILEEVIVPLHKIYDRNDENYYYIDDNDHTKGYITSLRTVNASMGSGEYLEVNYDLYYLLNLGKSLTISTNSAFNMFVGELSDFWNLLLLDSDQIELDPVNNAYNRAKVERLQSYLPLTEEEVEQTLELKEENNKYYVRFNAFNNAPVGDLSITFGGIAKGYANDVLSARLKEENLIHGAIFGGASSNTTLGSFFNNQVWEWPVASPKNPLEELAFTLARKGSYSMSTSGGYDLFRSYYIQDGDEMVLRHHIIDAHTGYPANKGTIDVNIVSNDLPSATLDALSTALMCLDFSDGLALRNTFIDEGKELHAVWMEVKNDPEELVVKYTRSYQPFLIESTGNTYQIND